MRLRPPAAWKRGSARCPANDGRYDYYGGADGIEPVGPACVDRAIFKIIPESASRVAALLSGDVHITNELPVFSMEQVDANEGTEVMTVNGTRSFFLALNNEGEYFDDVKDGRRWLTHRPGCPGRRELRGCVRRTDRNDGGGQRLGGSPEKAPTGSPPDKIELTLVSRFMPSIYHPLGWRKIMAENVVQLRERVSDTEKITINLGYVDLGRIDLLVQEGFYSNRTDFIRTAIRNQLTASRPRCRARSTGIRSSSACATWGGRSRGGAGRRRNAPRQGRRSGPHRP